MFQRKGSNSEYFKPLTFRGGDHSSAQDDPTIPLVLITVLIWSVLLHITLVLSHCLRDVQNTIPWEKYFKEEFEEEYFKEAFAEVASKWSLETHTSVEKNR